MPQLKLDVKIEEIQSLIFQLSPKELLTLADTIMERAETVGMMQQSETGFHEWNEKGEDIYNDQT